MQVKVGSVAYLLLAMFLAACSPTPAGSPTPNLPTEPQPATTEPAISEACQRAFAAAAAVDEMQDTVTDLDPAVQACVSLDEWAAGSASNPTALDGADPWEFLGNRCNSGEGLAETTLCGELLASCGVDPYADTTYCVIQSL